MQASANRIGSISTWRLLRELVLDGSAGIEGYAEALPPLPVLRRLLLGPDPDTCMPVADDPTGLQLSPHLMADRLRCCVAHCSCSVLFYNTPLHLCMQLHSPVACIASEALVWLLCRFLSLNQVHATDDSLAGALCGLPQLKVSLGVDSFNLIRQD